ncbi:hypothetical protein H072_6716 [Dactylellina haptotyla CBS 200.50]|uniref:Uncharacterized protein n=1 Tax=Dactylellina haptotyla (strain CBS 200.50) TaxID=1284197 RepID=S8BW75_DACHA|nr:hypothetical protein H072_6716 [Dactylellina haptotyla CBS 200.50]
MLCDYPDSLFHAQLSVVRLYFDKVENPTLVHIFLDLEPPSQQIQSIDRMVIDIPPDDEPEESEPGEILQDDEELVRDLDTAYLIGRQDSSILPSHHPMQPDIGRTSYRSIQQPSYREIHLCYRSDTKGNGVGAENQFHFSISLLENHIVFHGLTNIDRDSAKNIIMAQNVLGEVMYTAWITQVGIGIPIKDVTFMDLAPSTQSFLKRFKDVSRVGEGFVVKWSRLDRGFDEFWRSLLQFREGKAIESLETRYEAELRYPQVASIEYGLRASIAAKGQPFLLVGLSLGDDTFIERPKTTAELSLWALEYGARLLVECFTNGLDVRENGLPPRPRELDLDNFIPGFRISTFGSSQSANLYLDCPAQDQLAYIYDKERDLLTKVLVLEFEPQNIQNTRYYGVSVGPITESDNSYKFKIALNAILRHIIIVDLPTRSQDGNYAKLEDVIMAAWLKKYPKAVKPIAHATSLRGMIRFFSILKTSPETVRLLDLAYHCVGLTRDSPYAIRWPFHDINTADSKNEGKYRFGTIEDRVAWLLITACPEVSAILKLFTKHVAYLRLAYRINSIVIRWVGKSGFEQPEIFISIIGTQPAGALRAIDKMKLLPEIRSVAILGEIFSLVSLHLNFIEPPPDMQFEPTAEFRTVESRRPVKCPPKVRKIFRDSGLDLAGKRQLSGDNTYIRIETISRTDDLSYETLVSPVDRIIVVPSLVLNDDLDAEIGALRLTKVLFNTWIRHSRIAPLHPNQSKAGRRQQLTRTGHRLITFLRPCEQTVETIKYLWELALKYSDKLRESNPKEIQFRARRTTLTLGPGSKAESDLSSWQVCFFASLQGTTEISSVIRMLLRFHNKVGSKRINSIIVDSFGGRPTISVLLDASRNWRKKDEGEEEEEEEEE